MVYNLIEFVEGLSKRGFDPVACGWQIEVASRLHPWCSISSRGSHEISSGMVKARAARAEADGQSDMAADDAKRNGWRKSGRRCKML
jgi:hypothetical protein